MTANAVAVLLSILGFALGWVAGFASHAKLQQFDGDFDDNDD